VELTVVDSRPECLIGHAGPLSVCIWRGSPTAGAMHALATSLDRLAARHGRISTLVVVRPVRRVARPDPEVDALSVELCERLGSHCVGSATVIESSGVAAAIAHGQRARILPHCTAPNEAFPRVAEALAWIARLPGQDPALYAAPALAADVELLGRGDEDDSPAASR
jgi:hypothetical protein